MDDLNLLGIFALGFVLGGVSIGYHLHFYGRWIVQQKWLAVLKEKQGIELSELEKVALKELRLL